MTKRVYFFIGSIALISGIAGYSFRTPDTQDFEISKNMEIFGAVYKELNTNYVDMPQPGQLMKEGIDGMMRSLDPYTVYYPESDIEDFKIQTTGQYGGLGAVNRKKGDYTEVIETYEGYPASKAGLQPGDLILEIDGKSIKGWDQDEVSKHLKGTPGTAVKLKVRREGEQDFEKTLTREEVKIKDVPYYGMLNANTGYIKLVQFRITASSEVREAFVELKKQGMSQLVFDLRGNGGGLLIEAVKIVGLFVPKNTLVVSQKGRMPNSTETYYTKDEPLDTQMPMVFLIDENTASASEIVSGAMQDLDRAVVAGHRSYGKGLVQQTRNLPYNTMIKLTTSKYYIPSGRCIQKLDYSHKDESGKATMSVDSLSKKFKTKNGRDVYDGRGIEPDVTLDLPEYSKILVSLVRNQFIFDYAVKFRRNNAAIADAKTFALSDDQYMDFVNFVKSKDFSYTTQSKDVLDEFKKTAEKEKYFQGAEKEFEALLKKIEPKKEDDLIRFKNEIRDYLESDIVAIYYLQKGRYEHDLQNDLLVHKAIEVLNNKAGYAALLQPKK